MVAVFTVISDIRVWIRWEFLQNAERHFLVASSSQTRVVFQHLLLSVASPLNAIPCHSICLVALAALCCLILLPKPTKRRPVSCQLLNTATGRLLEYLLRDPWPLVSRNISDLARRYLGFVWCSLSTLVDATINSLLLYTTVSPLLLCLVRTVTKKRKRKTQQSICVNRKTKYASCNQSTSQWRALAPKASHHKV